ncbi:hypothetical protein CYL18_08325 [Pradoshia eiseniae]|uniref:Uncharacterized protein n=1 Tax=Pradoshia eiseniae TaxID=2064768 RepID=A0A2S7N1B9_9BACI|nr:hypothetical protein CYL18_08325 [Pradoshia eiseniae]
MNMEASTLYPPCCLYKKKITIIVGKKMSINYSYIIIRPFAAKDIRQCCRWMPIGLVIEFTLKTMNKGD